MISVSLSRELVSLCESKSSVFSQVVLVVEVDLVIDQPAALKGDPLYSGSGDESLPLVFGSIIPDPVLCKRKGINVSLLPTGSRNLVSYVDRVSKDRNAEVSINEASNAVSGDLSSDLHVFVMPISDLGQSDDGVRPMSSIPHGAVYSFPKGSNRISNGDSTNTADVFPIAAADDLSVADRAGSGSSFNTYALALVSMGIALTYSFPVKFELGGLAHHGWFWFWIYLRRRWFRVKQISHSVDSGTGSGIGSISYAIVDGSGTDSRGHGGGDSRFHLGLAFQSTILFRSYLSSAAVINTSMWSPFQMGHSFHAIGDDGTGSGRRGHGGEDYAALFSGFCCAWLLFGGWPGC